jgi:predicted DNA-binding protein
MSKRKKECILQYRCTEEEKRYIDKMAKKKGVNRSEYIREMIFNKNSTNINWAEFVVTAQELLNRVEPYYQEHDRKIERLINKLWNLL